MTGLSPSRFHACAVCWAERARGLLGKSRPRQRKYGDQCRARAALARRVSGGVSSGGGLTTSVGGNGQTVVTDCVAPAPPQGARRSGV